jgi:hypothetical protein
MYQVTRTFTGGALKGLVHTETTSVAMTEGLVVDRPCGGGSPYRVTKVVALPAS